MTKRTYLNRLEKSLTGLSETEITDAIAYYSNYFDDSNDDEKVINELGDPEELAKVIKEKSQKHLVEVTDADSKSENTSEKSDGLYYEFDKNLVKNLTLNIGAAEVVIITGNTYSVETRGIEESAMNCDLSPNGNLIINNQRRINIEFWKHNRRYRAVPRILVSVPDKANLDVLKVKIGAGSIVAKAVTVTANKGEFEVGAGNLILNKIDIQTAKIKCGMGNLNYTGSVAISAEIDCGMGNLSMNLKGNPDAVSYDAKVGLGDFKFNDEKKSGVGQVECSSKKQTHLSVNCGMGSVVIKVGE